MSEEHLTAEEQAQFDGMRDADAQLGSDQPTADPAAAQPPADPAQPPTDPAQPQPQKTVPLAALHEERERRKQAEKERGEERERMRVLEERTNLILERFSQQQPAAQVPSEPAKPTYPTLEQDPILHFVGKQQDLERQLAAQSNAWQQQQSELHQRLQAHQAQAALVQQAQAFEKEFERDNPDYRQAVDHLTAIRHRELELMGYADPVSRHQQIQWEGMQLAWKSIQERRNPAEAIYGLAKIRGFGAAQPAQAQPTAQQTDGQSITPQQKLETVAAGQQQARSLGNASGAGPGPLTAQRLLAMSHEDFYKTIQTDEGRALLGA